MEEKKPEERKLPWYFGGGSLLVAFFCVGPLMLPLVWTHPKMPQARKILWTVVILRVTYALIEITAESMKRIGEYYQEMKAALPSGLATSAVRGGLFRIG